LAVHERFAKFYCPAEKLIIELDGISRDTERDKHLEMMNIKVLRFENKEVFNNLTQVLQKIKVHFISS
jgi:very-short-patch-repair endonuclease